MNCGEGLTTALAGALEFYGYDGGVRGAVAKGFSIITALALITLGALVLNGRLPLFAMGVTTASLGAGKILYEVVGHGYRCQDKSQTNKTLGNFEDELEVISKDGMDGDRPITIITVLLSSAGYIATGTLAAIGMLTATQLGWAMIGITVSALAFWVLFGFIVHATRSCCCKNRQI